MLVFRGAAYGLTRVAAVRTARCMVAVRQSVQSATDWRHALRGIHLPTVASSGTSTRASGRRGPQLSARSGQCRSVTTDSGGPWSRASAAPASLAARFGCSPGATARSIPCRRAYLGDVAALSRQRLPPRGHVVNLCRDRYRFAVGFAAALCRRQVTLLPPNDTPGNARPARRRTIRTSIASSMPLCRTVPSFSTIHRI